MTTEEKNALIAQVVKTIHKEKGNEDYNYFGSFFNDCHKYGVSESEFNKVVLRPAFERYEGLLEDDPEITIPNRNRFVDLFDKRCYNPLQLARVLFEHPSKSEEYLEDDTFIKHDVTLLTSSSTIGLEVARIFKTEKDADLRYLKIIYSLNKKLPYRVGNEVFGQLNEMVERGASDYSFHSLLANDFLKGKLQIWLRETAPEIAATLPLGNEYTDFLTFVYFRNSQYPMYLYGKRVAGAADLLAAAKSEIELWPVLYDHIANGQLEIWFNAIGKPEWVDGTYEELERLETITFLDDEDKKFALVQGLIQRMDPNAVPQLKPEAEKISLPSIQHKSPFEHTLSIRLANQGFEKAVVSIYPEVEGIKLHTEQIYFHDLSGRTTNDINLSIDPQQLIRNKVYNLTLSVEAIHQTLKIPIDLKVTFPTRYFIKENVILSLIMMAFFGFIRYLLSLEFPDWIRNYNGSFLSVEEILYNPEPFYIFGGIFLLFLLGIFLSAFIVIRKFWNYG